MYRCSTAPTAASRSRTSRCSRCSTTRKHPPARATAIICSSGSSRSCGSRRSAPDGWVERTQRTKAIIATALSLLFAVVLPILRADLAQGGASSPADAPMALVKAYPDFIDRIEDNDLVWKDGTRMRIDDGKGAKAFDAMLDDPDVKDMFVMKYPVGEQPGASRQFR